MKILQINSFYKEGSTGKITYDIHSALQKLGYESYVVYGRDKGLKEENTYPVISLKMSKIMHGLSLVDGKPYSHCYFATKKIIKHIEEIKPDIVHLQCINGYFVNIFELIDYLKKQNIKTILTLHAEFMFTANCGYAFECDGWKTGCKNCTTEKYLLKPLNFHSEASNWNCMNEAFKGFNNIIVASVSPWLMNRAKTSPILADKQHTVVLNGLDTSVFRRYNIDEIPKKIKDLFSKKTILHVTPNFNNEIKGGYYVRELAKMMPEYNFVVVGANGDEQVTSNVNLIRHTNNQQELAMMYSLADVTLLTSKRETFSMVLAESLCCGTPFVGFYAGGPESIAIDEYCKFVDYADVSALRETIKQMLSYNFSNEHIADIAKKKYSKDIMIQRYIRLYE